jgi:CTP synthase
LFKWQELIENLKNPSDEVRIGIGGKYTDLGDAYISITKALKHVGAHLRLKVRSSFIETTDLDDETIERHFKNFDGIIIPGGFGHRGISGKIAIIKRIRENSIPFLGICLGLQCAVIEFARNVCNLSGANSTEFNEDTPYPVVSLLPSQQSVYQKGGTMRLGGYPIKISKDTLAYEIYNESTIRERFRHRFEVNPEFIPKLEAEGMVFSGTSINGEVVHMIELPTHPFFIGTQFHPEFLSHFEQPSKLFMAFVQACLTRKTKRTSS